MTCPLGHTFGTPRHREFDAASLSVIKKILRADLNVVTI